MGERLNRWYQDRALVEVWNGKKWTIANIPQPGDGGSELPLIEHR